MTMLESPYKAETKRLWLEELSVEKHLVDYHDIWSNPNALIWSMHEAKKSLGESKELMMPNTNSSERPWVDNYAILLRPPLSTPGGRQNSDEGPKMIGLVGVIRSIEVAEGHRLEIGYIINYDYWGKGYASEALGAFLDLFFDLKEPKAQEVVAKVDTENFASIRILKKMEERGYKIREGELVKGEISIPRKGLRDMRTWYICKSIDS